MTKSLIIWIMCRLVYAGRATSIVYPSKLALLLYFNVIHIYNNYLYIFATFYNKMTAFDIQNICVKYLFPRFMFSFGRFKLLRYFT